MLLLGCKLEWLPKTNFPVEPDEICRLEICIFLPVLDAMKIIMVLVVIKTKYFLTRFCTFSFCLHSMLWCMACSINRMHRSEVYRVVKTVKIHKCFSHINRSMAFRPCCLNPAHKISLWAMWFFKYICFTTASSHQQPWFWGRHWPRLWYYPISYNLLQDFSSDLIEKSWTQEIWTN